MLPGSTQFDITKLRDKDSPLLNEEAKVFFHTKTAQLLYLSNHLHGELSYYVNRLTLTLCQRVHHPTEDDLKKLYHVLGYVKMSIHDILELDASMLSDPKIYIDASYANAAPPFPRRRSLASYPASVNDCAVANSH